MKQRDTISVRDGVGRVSDLIHNELAVVADNGLHNDYRVNYDLVNSKAYHDKFEGMTEHRAVDEGLYRRSAQMLEHRSGSPYEDIAMLDARTGEVLMENTSAAGGAEFQSGLTNDQSEELNAMGRQFEILHNHPNSTPPSRDDIKWLYKRTLATASNVACHDGTIHRMKKLKPYPNIEELISRVYSQIRKIHHNWDEEAIEYKVSIQLIEILQRQRYMRYSKR